MKCVALLYLPLVNFICIIYPFTAFIQMQADPADMHPEYFIGEGELTPHPAYIYNFGLIVKPLLQK
jgi:hypothetical protein